jgi:succinylglutamate desuccinylase
MKKLLVAHLRGMEDCLEIAAGDAVKHGDEEAAVELLRRMQHVLESVIQGPAWKSLQEEE